MDQGRRGGTWPLNTQKKKQVQVNLITGERNAVKTRKTKMAKRPTEIKAEQKIKELAKAKRKKQFDETMDEEKRWIEKGNKPELLFDLSDDENIRLTSSGMQLIKERKRRNIKTGEIETDESYRHIFKGHFSPLKRLELDNEMFFEVETRQCFRGNVEDIINQLRKEGGVVNKARIADAVNCVLHGSDVETITGYSTYGVYENDARLHLCLNPYPITEIQVRVDRDIKNALKIPLNKTNVECWFSVPGFWDKYEVYPVLGLSIMAPFALILRDKGIIVPNIFHVSPESGLGKTESMKAYSQSLFGRRIISSDAINSDFRLADNLDSYGGLICVEEGESFNWGRFSPHLQLSAEQPLQDIRGKPNLGSRQYWSRAVLGFTGNYFPVKRKATLVRFVAVDFNRNKAKERRGKKKDLRLAMKKLKPIGWKIAEIEVNELDSSISNLIDQIEKHEYNLDEKYAGGFTDPRRSKSWAIIFEGLRLWGVVAKTYNVDWSPPTIDEFIETVVSPNETRAFENVEVPAEAFISWWESWCAKNKENITIGDDYNKKTVKEVKGKNDIWREACAENYSGHVITKAVLSLYEQDNKHKVFLPINTLTDLGKGIAALYGLNMSKIYKDWKFGRKTLKGVFIPLEECSIGMESK